jgi:hypothetical protein
VKLQAFRQSKVSGKLLRGKKLARDKDKACLHLSMFNLGHLCDELGALLQPMCQTSYGRRLIRDIESHKKAMEKMNEESVQLFIKKIAPLRGEPEVEIQKIIGRYVSPFDRILIEEISTDLKLVSKFISVQIDARNKLDHYLSSLEDPPVNADLRSKIRADCSRALLILGVDKDLIVEAQRILKPFNVMFRRKRNPDLMNAGVLLVQHFRNHGSSKGESIRRAYDLLSIWAPNNISTSLHSFHVRINRHLLHNMRDRRIPFIIPVVSARASIAPSSSAMSLTMLSRGERVLALGG